MQKAFLFILFLTVQMAACAATDIEIANDEITKTVCSADVLSAQIKALVPVVPSRLYHVGRTDHLYENIAAGNVPQDDWDNFIMKGKSRWGLVNSRRGLYGTVGLDTNGVGRGEYNWVMEVSLKPECRKPERVATLDNLHLDLRFIAWFPKARRKMTFEDFKSKCVITLDTYAGYTRKDCEEIAMTFLKDLNIAIVQDHIIGKSFYIRSRECIRDISGTPDEWITWLTEMPNLWLSHCSRDHRYIMPGLLIRTLMNMEKEFTTAHAEKLRAHIQTMGRHKTFGRIKAVVMKAIDAKLRCGRKFKNQLLLKIPSADESFEFYSLMDPMTLDGLCKRKED